MERKKRNVILIFTCFILICLIASCKESPVIPPEKNRTELWTEDIDYLSSQLKAKQYNFSVLISGQNFDNTLNNIKNSIDSLKDYEIYIKLQQLIASFHIAHFIIYPSSTLLHAIPIRTYVFPDGVYIITTIDQYSYLLGKKIISIGGAPIQTVEDSLRKIISYENDYWFEDQFPSTVQVVEVLKYYGFINDLLSVNMEIEGGGDVAVPSINSSSSFHSVLDGKTLPLYLQNQSSYYWFTFLEGNHILYIKYNKCTQSPDKSFSSFTNEIEAYILSHQTEKVVVDLRNNGGGNSSIINPLLNYLESSGFNEKGKLFVITNRGTFSSALLNAISFKQYTNCILLGEPPGGKPNAYGEVHTFALPNSGLNVQYCVKYFSTMDGDPEALFPDYDIEITAQDFIDGKDPVLDFVMSYR